MATLSSYLADTRRTLHDASGKYWTDADLTSYINRAMQQRDWDTGQNRLLQSIALSVGQSVYTFNQSPFNTSTLDVLGIVVLVGNFRYQLAQVGYTELGSVLQPYQGYQSIPVGFAKYKANTVILAPIPQQAYTAEFDTLIASTALVANTDADPLPYPWTDPVPFLAAHFAKLALQQYDEADKFLQLYQQRLMWVTAGSRGMGIAQPYSGNATGAH